MEYIHYGHENFDIKLFNKIKNRPEAVKPIGGLWASRVDTTDGWIDWCKGNEIDWARLDVSFKFKLKPEAKVLLIDSMDKLKELPKQKSILGHSPWTLLDFEKLAEEYDAVEVILNRGLYFELYGWDCDSIIIMNPEIIELIKE
ncbi:MAG: hypothetical protein IJN03_02750 [Bacilli bacterium]|nr:hypothetical protein [Bacilli bacterium]MBQ2938516.1 hypothetical protein [Clostridia bacterium]MBQ6687423.1 hypothetical protein [Bacilli bacterium]